jgi:hypothetical protein
MQIPIIIVGNKSDLKENQASSALEEQVLPVMNEFKVISALYKMIK